MKIIQIQKNLPNLYLVTFERKKFFKTITEERYVYMYGGFIRFADNDKTIDFELGTSIISIIPQLNGYEPLKIKQMKNGK